MTAAKEDDFGLVETVGSSGDESFGSRLTIRGNMRLERGDRVQVVSIEGGWAKLARGYGFVHCPRGNELVKGESVFSAR